MVSLVINEMWWGNAIIKIRQNKQQETLEGLPQSAFTNWQVGFLMKINNITKGLNYLVVLAIIVRLYKLSFWDLEKHCRLFGRENKCERCNYFPYYKNGLTLTYCTCRSYKHVICKMTFWVLTLSVLSPNKVFSLQKKNLIKIVVLLGFL